MESQRVGHYWVRPRPGHSPPSDGENSDYCRTRVGRGKEGRQDHGWVWWGDWGEGYLPLVTSPLSRFCRALPATEAAAFSLKGEYTLVLPPWFSGKDSACQPKDMGLTPGLGRSPRGANGNPVQYSWPGNPMDRGAWQTTVHGATKSWTRLSNGAWV